LKEPYFVIKRGGAIYRSLSLVKGGKVLSTSMLDPFLDNERSGEIRRILKMGRRKD